MQTLDYTLYEKLLDVIDASDPSSISLSTEADNYRHFRSLIAEANYANRSWLQEFDPECPEAKKLKKVADDQWNKCHSFLLDMLGSAQWSPEWLGWLASSSLSTDNAWMAFSLSLKLLDTWLQESTDIDNEDMSNAMKRLGSILVDEAGDPPIVSSLLYMPSLIGNLSLEKLNNTALDELSPALEELESNKKWLTDAHKLIESLCNHFNRYSQRVHMNKLKKRIEQCLSLLAHYDQIDDATTAEVKNDTLTETSDNIEAIDTTNIIQNPTSYASYSRQKACQELQELINYFRTAEPHSPVSWLLEKAQKWLDMDFPELLKDMTWNQKELYTDICGKSGLHELSFEQAQNTPIHSDIKSSNENDRQTKETNTFNIEDL